ncbi:MAG TPA: nuclear transport factor 2 family protein [Myxococcota bacterium]
MIERADAEKLAAHWVAAWNAHDLDAILSHYRDDVEIASPVVVQLLGTPDGRVVGKPALRAYFARGLAAFPELRFDLKGVFVGTDTVVLYYANQRGTHTAEVMELDANGKVTRMRATYSG